MSNNKENSSTNINNISNLMDDEIDLRHIAGSLIRHKGLLTKFAYGSLLLSVIYALFQKQVWQGEFQIVLESSDQGYNSLVSQSLSSNPLLANFIGANKQQSLQTEVKILKSPSVLKPVFDFVKQKKSKKGIDYTGLSYSDWVKGSLRIYLEGNTPVLNITYKDTDKTMIIPVMNLISNTYQEYSGRDRERGLTQGITYLEKQSVAMREQSNKSMRQAQTFALNNGLGLQDGMPSTTTSINSVQFNREKAQNKVNKLEQQLNFAKTSTDDSVYIAPQLKANSELYSKLQSLESELADKSALFKPSDQSIKTLKRKISSLKTYLNRQTTGLIQGEFDTTKAELASLTRPTKILLQHRELVRNALRDEKTLNDLETKLQILKLDKARQANPWELISTPTLLDNPVAPRRKRIVALGFLGGLILGSLTTILLDRRTGLIFNIDEFKNQLPYPLLKHFSIKTKDNWDMIINLLAQGPLKIDKSSSIAIIPVGDFPPQQINEFSMKLKQALKGGEIIVSKDLMQTRSCSKQLLVTSPEIATKTEVRELVQQLTIQGKPVSGWVYIDSEKVL